MPKNAVEATKSIPPVIGPGAARKTPVELVDGEWQLDPDYEWRLGILRDARLTISDRLVGVYLAVICASEWRSPEVSEIAAVLGIEEPKVQASINMLLATDWLRGVAPYDPLEPAS